MTCEKWVYTDIGQGCKWIYRVYTSSIYSGHILSNTSFTLNQALPILPTAYLRVQAGIYFINPLNFSVYVGIYSVFETCPWNPNNLKYRLAKPIYSISPVGRMERNSIVTKCAYTGIWLYDRDMNWTYGSYRHMT